MYIKARMVVNVENIMSKTRGIIHELFDTPLCGRTRGVSRGNHCGDL